MASYRDLDTALRNLLASLTLLALVYAVPAVAAALKNTTITVPGETSDHGDPNLLCTPTKWTDIVIFYLGNYFAHAATVIALPGESAGSMGVTAFLALLFPTSGVIRGVSAILACAKNGKTALETAQRSQALCMLARTADWRPQMGDSVSNCVIKMGPAPPPPSAVVRVYRTPWSSNSLATIPADSAIHGSFSFPQDGGYQFALVPRDAKLVPPPNTENQANSEIACNYNALKSLVALGQSIYAITTLYGTRGDQIDQYGYAAFGLTVAPYAIMSLINLIGGMVTPQYPCLYMVESSIMDEAQSRPGCYFQGTVGRLAELQSKRLQHWESEEKHFRLLNRPVSFEQVDGTAIRAQVCISTNDGYDTLQSAQLDISQDNIIGIEMSTVGDQEESIILQIEDEQNQAAALPRDDHGNEEAAGDTDRAMPVPQTSQNHADPSEIVLFVPDSNPTSLLRGRFGHGSPIPLSAMSELGEIDELSTGFGILLSLVPLAIIGGLSRFRNGKSTKAQRGWTMSWWVFGLVSGYATGFASIEPEDYQRNKHFVKLGFIIYAGPAIGGFVVVGQMLASYGTCIRIS